MSELPQMQVLENGNREWRNDQGHLHRVDGPAVEGADGARSWWLNDELHREDGPAYEGADGTREWWLNDELHREDGPAYEGADGTREWRLNGKLHRVDGPAYEWADGDREWWLDGKHLEFGDYVNRIFPEHTPEKMMFILRWSGK